MSFQIPAPNPAWQAAREACADRIRKGTNGPGTTTASRLSWLEYQLQVLACAPGFAATFMQIEEGGRAIVQHERISAVLELRGAELEAGLLALSDSEFKAIGGFIKLEHVESLLAHPETCEAVLGLLSKSVAAEYVFALRPVDPWVRVVRLVKGRAPSTEHVPAAEAPAPSPTCLIEELPEAVSRSLAQAAWASSGEDLPSLAD